MSPGAALGSVDYDECGSGPAVVLVPGSCSTGAAWRAVIAHLESSFRCITTSLLGYGNTEERRSQGDASISHECRAIEGVIARAGGRVHLVGHSFGGLVSLAVALRRQAALASLTIFEAPAVSVLRGKGEERHYDAFRSLTDGYFAAYQAGNREAISAHDRFLRRCRYICLMALAHSVVRDGENAREYARLGDCLRLCPFGQFAVSD